MPELPEVETIMQEVRSTLEGKRIQKAQINRPDLRRPFPPHLAENLMGETVIRVGRRAKYILIDLSSAQTLLIHLGMSGRIFIDSPNAPTSQRKHEHFSITLENGFSLYLVDPRRFGMVDLFPSKESSQPRFLRQLGVEPLEEGVLTASSLRQMFQTTRSPIKNALLDQSKIVGLGNIYVCEVLFRTSIHPQAAANSLSDKAYARLSTEIPAVLREAISAGGSSLRDYVTTDGKPGGFQDLHHVYNRAGEKCSMCAKKGKNTLIERITQSGRSTFFCPQHQKSDA